MLTRNSELDVTDPWAWWRAALANPKAVGITLLMSTTPEQGFYRRKLSKGGQWVPVIIWHDASGWNAWRTVDGQVVVKDAHEEWLYCRDNPITQEVYEAVAERGEPWPDVDSVVHAQRTPPRPGDNAGERSESQMLADDIQAALDQLRAYKVVEDDDTAGKAQSLRARLLDLSGKADKIREKLVRPHLDAQKDINGEWQPLVKDAKGGADTLRKTLEGYETAKLRSRRAAEEAARKAEEEAANREAELSFARGEPEPEIVNPPAPPAEVATQVKGSYGKAAAVRAKRVVTAITNPIELFKHFAADPRVEALLMKLAQEGIDGGYTVPGVVVEERATVK